MIRTFREKLFGAENGDASLVEAVRILLSGDVEVHGEDQVGSGEVQIHRKRHLQAEETAQLGALNQWIQWFCSGAAGTMCLLSALLCFIQRSCVSGSSVEMELDRDSLLLPQVAPCSFRPGRDKPEPIKIQSDPLLKYCTFHLNKIMLNVQQTVYYLYKSKIIKT